MDTASTFKPKTILLWRQAAEDPEALRILKMFPSAQVRLIERQRMTFSPEMSPSRALLAGHFLLAAGAYGNRAGKLLSRNFVRGASDRKLRYPPKQRIEFYAHLIDTIRSFDKNISIGLCRETPEIWSVFKDRCKAGKCNCVNW